MEQERVSESIQGGARSRVQGKRGRKEKAKGLAVEGPENVRGKRRRGEGQVGRYSTPKPAVSSTLGRVRSAQPSV